MMAREQIEEMGRSARERVVELSDSSRCQGNVLVEGLPACHIPRHQEARRRRWSSTSRIQFTLDLG